MSAAQLNRLRLWLVQAYGLPSCALLLVCWSSEQSVRVLTQWWLSQWTASEGRRQISEELGAHPDLAPAHQLLATLSFES